MIAFSFLIQYSLHYWRKRIRLTGHINIMHMMTPFDHSIPAVRMEENGVHLSI